MGTVLDVASLKKPDGSPYLSGTEWEFEDAWNANPQPEIMVYRSVNVPAVPLNDPDRKEKQSQYDKVETVLSASRTLTAPGAAASTTSPTQRTSGKNWQPTSSRSLEVAPKR